ncbi:D-alanine--D-alanine ligase family protein [Spelaeicoccus albus]|uniref:D-alanine--D-alanine ligase n=1 Tax=Spelaeicoccus albus TaxID=1280376 RepID=A0A7Z0D2L6_9MICO|nr:D-alanine--D-alanine ligase family protein [Spelaeicoccus albus]NYI67720.1 D-alanine-D-alanine ligase [Spelaeicoccus albus]
MNNSSKPRVAVVFGGRSSEHAVSCATAAGVLEAIDRDSYDVIALGITRSGQWVQAPDRPQYALESGNLPEVDPAAGTVLMPLDADTKQVIVTETGRVPETLGSVDVVFPLLHGPYGEDGTLQGLLELSDTRYVGAGVFASAVSMDKHYMKVVLEAAGLPVGPYEVVTDRQWRTDPDAARRRIAGLGFPVFVKPARAGSSIGISKVAGPDDLDAAIAEAHRHDRKVVIEAGIDGREVECGVLSGFGDDPPETSLPGEIVVTGGHDFYDFDAKYLDESSIELTCPADLDAATTAAVRDAASRTFEAVGCEGLARVDVFVTPGGEVVVNEINTMPGFTPFSMFPRVWQASGLDYPALVDRLIRLALDRPTGLR